MSAGTATIQERYASLIERAGDFIDGEPYQAALSDTASILRRGPAIAGVVAYAFAAGGIDELRNQEWSFAAQSSDGFEEGRLGWRGLAVTGACAVYAAGTLIVETVGELAAKGLNNIQQ